MRLKGKVSVITGAGRGIGFEAAKLFAEEGSKVYILEVNESNGKQAESMIKKQGGEAEYIKVDVSNINDVRKAFSIIKNNEGKLDVLYNNASVFLGKHDNCVSNLSINTWQKILSINLNGLFYCSKYAIPLMLESSGGCIINTSSSAGVIGIPNCDAYTASKGATVSLTRSMAVEYGPKDIRVNCIAPAAIKTPMVKESNLDDPDFDEKEFLQNGTPLRRWGKAQEIAKIALFLASDESSYVNGAIITADGGITVS